MYDTSNFYLKNHYCVSNNINIRIEFEQEIYNFHIFELNH